MPCTAFTHSTSAFTHSPPPRLLLLFTIPLQHLPHLPHLPLPRHSWNHQDFVPVFAVGNFGASAQATGTATTPATAKNCIAVGASLSTHDSSTSVGLQAPVYRVQLVVSAAGGTGSQLFNRTFRVLQVREWVRSWSSSNTDLV